MLQLKQRERERKRTKYGNKNIYKPFCKVLEIIIDIQGDLF